MVKILLYHIMSNLDLLSTTRVYHFYTLLYTYTCVRKICIELFSFYLCVRLQTSFMQLALHSMFFFKLLCEMYPLFPKSHNCYNK